MRTRRVYYPKTKLRLLSPIESYHGERFSDIDPNPIFKIGDEVIWARGTRSECPARITKRNKDGTYNIRYHTGWLKGKLRRNISGSKLSKQSGTYFDTPGRTQKSRKNKKVRRTKNKKL
jgi:hypothetical protein